MGASKRRRVVAIVAALTALSLVPLAVVTRAQDRARNDRATLVRTLEGHRDFRLRVQAAFALGNAQDAASVSPLERALHDANPAVRAAAATSLGRIGSPRALPALRRALTDGSAAVRLQVVASIRALESGRHRDV